MDLFTVDTVGEQNLLDREEFDNLEILYKNHSFVESNQDQHETGDDQRSADTEIGGDDDDDTVIDYDYGGKHIKKIYKKNIFVSLLNFFVHFKQGLPSPSEDIHTILQNPALFNKSLYSKEETDSKEADNDLDAFCKAMGWTKIDGVLPKRLTKKPKHWEQDDIDLTDVHKDFTKTNVAKEMSGSVLKGIQNKRDVKVLSEREAHRQRKVFNIMLNLFCPLDEL